MSLPKLRPITIQDLTTLQKGSIIYYQTEGWKMPYIAKMKVEFIDTEYNRIRARCIDKLASDPNGIGLESTNAPLQCFLVPAEL